MLVPPPGESHGFYNITTDAYMLFEPETSLWHMWATEMPMNNSGYGLGSKIWGQNRLSAPGK